MSSEDPTLHSLAIGIPLTLCEYRLRLVMSTRFVFYSLMSVLPPEPRSTFLSTQSALYDSHIAGQPLNATDSPNLDTHPYITHPGISTSRHAALYAIFFSRGLNTSGAL